jgi:TPR repeat protein
MIRILTTACTSAVMHPRYQLLRANPVAAVEDRAFRLFQRAATMNDPVALLRIGDYHYYGRAALPPSAEKAATYYKASTEHGRSAQVRRHAAVRLRHSTPLLDAFQSGLFHNSFPSQHW